ncbi:MAG: beta-glucosidase [Candidatus Acidiferrales bacterium]
MQLRSREMASVTMKRFGRAACLLVAVIVVSISMPARSGNSPESADDRRADAILAKMTLEQRIDYLGGVDNFYVRAMPEIGVPALRMADGPMGVRNYGPATAMAAGINLAATWDPELAQRVGEQIGRDARAKGVNFLLGPGLNIYRAPMNGRNFEYFGEDPYLAGRIAVGYIDGVQSEGVSATAKHYMGNNSEFDRHNVDSVIDERTMREIYLPAFEAAVKEAHVGAMMDSYNKVNGEHATQNEMLNTQILKREWGFEGVLMSDWLATYDGVAAAKSGMDLEMPSGMFMNRNSLLPAVKDGRLGESQLDDKVRRILRLAVKSHWLDREQTDASIPRYNLEGRQAALEAAHEGIVLLKNEGNVLPLDRHAIKNVAVIGPDAFPAVYVGGGSAGVRAFSAVSILEGVANALGPSVRTTYRRGIPELAELAQATSFTTSPTGGSPGLLAEYFSNPNLEGDPAIRRTDFHINFGTDSNADLGAFSMSYPAGQSSARWRGYYTSASSEPYDLIVETTGEAGGAYRVYVDEKLALDSWKGARALVDVATMTLNTGSHKIEVQHRGTPGFLGMRFRLGIVRRNGYVDAATEKIAAAADAVVVAVGFDPQSESEGADRTFRLPPGQDQLIERVAALNKRTVVLITSGGAVDAAAWIDRVPAVLENWYPGQEGGTAIAGILTGDVDPSGRLPISWDRRWEDNPAHDSYYPAEGTDRVEYKEGVFTGYRGYERSGPKPLFSFGFGLSYTTFGYKNLTLRPAATATGASVERARDPELRYEVAFDVTNTGHRDGADVAEVYVGETHPSVPRPERELKGFARVNLRAGETKRVKVLLDGRAFAFFDTAAHEWRVDPGEFAVSVGRSVDNVRLTSKITLSNAQAAGGTAKP